MMEPTFKCEACGKYIEIIDRIICVACGKEICLSCLEPDEDGDGRCPFCGELC